MPAKCRDREAGGSLRGINIHRWDVFPSVGEPVIPDRRILEHLHQQQRRAPLVGLQMNVVDYCLSIIE